MHWDCRNIPVLADTLAYWRAKRRAGALPKRRDIDPTEIGPLLANLQLIDVIDGGSRYRYRLVGTNIVAAFGGEYTGKFLDELFTGERLAYARRVYATVCSRMTPVFLRNRYSTTLDVEMIANRLYMPLSDDGCSVNIILGALSFEFGRDSAPGFWSTAQLDPSTATLTIIEDEAILA